MFRYLFADSRSPALRINQQLLQLGQPQVKINHEIQNNQKRISCAPIAPNSNAKPSSANRLELGRRISAEF